MFLRSTSLSYTIFYHMLEQIFVVLIGGRFYSTDVSGLNIIWSLRLTDKALDRNTLCAFLIAGQHLRQESHQWNPCKKNIVERFSWIGFVAVTLVWPLLESKERSSLLDSSIHLGCEVFHFHPEDEAVGEYFLPDIARIANAVQVTIWL